MSELNTEIKFEVKTNDMAIVNTMMKKMISSLDVGELDIIEEAKVTQIIAEVEVDYDAFEKNGTQ